MRSKSRRHPWVSRLPLRWSTRGLLLAVLLSGLALGWIARLASLQGKAVAAIERVGGSVKYRRAIDEIIYASRQKRGDRVWCFVHDLKGWVARHYDINLCYVVDQVHLTSESQVPQDILEHIGSLRCLKGLTLSGRGVSDSSLIHLRPLGQLETLSLAESRVTDAGLQSLENFPELQILLLQGAEITDDGLPHLSKLKKLKYLNMYGAQVIAGDRTIRVTYHGIRNLQDALPRTIIYPLPEELRSSVPGT